MDRYIGLDVHSTSCTIAVVGPSGRKLQSQVLETNGQALVSLVKTLPRPREGFAVRMSHTLSPRGRTSIRTVRVD